jgi:hypothetical protein
VRALLVHLKGAILRLEDDEVIQVDAQMHITARLVADGRCTGASHTHRRRSVSVRLLSASVRHSGACSSPELDALHEI